ncbi:hypothetical protein [Saccharopolyspora flava]|nr:hypothetical protein [Saccharopolyspora flava]
MSNNNRARSERTRRTAAIIAAAGASGVLIAMGGTVHHCTPGQGRNARESSSFR